MRFVAQQQSVPGVQAQMDPIPDCGENSYQGSGKLLGKNAIITGGDSGSAARSRSRSHAKAPTS